MEAEQQNGSAGRLAAKVAAGVLLAAVVGFVWIQYGDRLSLENLAARESAIREYGLSHPVLVYAITVLVYVSVTGLSLPGATVLTLVVGWYFGFWRGLVLVSFASTAGATLAFLLSRYILRDAIQNRFGSRLEKFNEALKREGAFYLFTLRLIPAVPFFVINVVMGLTPLKTWTFWWVSQVGMLAGTAVYVYAGSAVPDLQTLAERGASGILTPQLILAFVLLGVFPITVRKIMQKFRPADPSTGEQPPHSAADSHPPHFAADSDPPRPGSSESDTSV